MLSIFEDDVDGLDVAHPNLSKFAKATHEFSCLHQIEYEQPDQLWRAVRALERISSCVGEGNRPVIAALLCPGRVW